MLPCLECAAFRTWVMPSLCNVFLFCAMALENKQKKTHMKGWKLLSLHQTSSTLHQHLHISYVQVGPDFIHRCETHFAGIQDELQLFNGYSVLLPVAPGHIFPSRELLQQTLTQFLPPVPSASSVSQCEQLTERHQQVVVWMQLSSKFSSLCSACALCMWSYLTLFVIDFSPFQHSLLPLRTREGINMSAIYDVHTKLDKGSQCWIEFYFIFLNRRNLPGLF